MKLKLPLSQEMKEAAALLMDRTLPGSQMVTAEQFAPVWDALLRLAVNEPEPNDYETVYKWGLVPLLGDLVREFVVKE